MESLLVFAKAPLKGRVKTRLADDRGPEDALKLYAGFLRDTIATVSRWNAERAAVDLNRRLVLCVTPDVEDPLLAALAQAAGAQLVVQSEGDLGARLANAFAAEFKRGARAVAAIGADSPTLPLHLLDHAFRALLFERVVVGPTLDGGYWLVGAQRPAPDLFTDIPWSTPSVLQRTLAHLRAQSVDAKLLPFWYDVDDAHDVETLVWHLRALRAHDKSVGQATWDALVAIGLVRERRAA